MKALAKAGRVARVGQQFDQRRLGVGHVGMSLEGLPDAGALQDGLQVHHSLAGHVVEHRLAGVVVHYGPVQVERRHRTRLVLL